MSVAVPNLNLPSDAYFAIKVLLVYNFNVSSSPAIIDVVSASLVNPISVFQALLLYPSNVFLVELYLIWPSAWTSTPGRCPVSPTGSWIASVAKISSVTLDVLCALPIANLPLSIVKLVPITVLPDTFISPPIPIPPSTIIEPVLESVLFILSVTCIWLELITLVELSVSLSE